MADLERADNFASARINTLERNKVDKTELEKLSPEWRILLIDLGGII